MTPAPHHTVSRCPACGHDTYLWPDGIRWDPSQSEAAKNPGARFRGGNGGWHHCSAIPIHDPMARAEVPVFFEWNGVKA